MVQTPTPGQQTGEELLGTLALLGGSYLSGRNGRLSAFGAPLQLAGGGLLGMGYQGGQARLEKQHDAAGMAALKGAEPTMFGAAGPDQTKAQLAGALLNAGVPIGQVKDYNQLTQIVKYVATKPGEKGKKDDQYISGRW